MTTENVSTLKYAQFQKLKFDFIVKEKMGVAWLMNSHLHIMYIL